MTKKVFITTSIPYVNAEPHIGFAMELCQADAITRYYRSQLGNNQVRFINGTDEHGSKIAKKASDEGISPQELTDKISQKFIELGKKLNITNDDFVCTSSERHKKSAVELWNRCQRDIYKKNYQSLYCSGCEEFKTEKELKDGNCPIHQTKPELVNEENYFFALSKYAKQIETLIKSDKLKITPELRKNEVLNWLKEGVLDVSISRDRSKLDWGIPVPSDKNQTMYVWVDALSNYLTGAGFPESDYKNWWSEEVAKIHIIGKDILRFHAIIWPGLLLSAGLPLPNIIYVHGHITADNQKMSKSLGNVVDPFTIINKYGAAALRYYLLAKIPYDGDGDFSIEKFKAVYKGELADNWGNLLNRLVVLAGKADVPTKLRIERNYEITNTTNKLEQFQFNLFIEEKIKRLSEINREINEQKPWEIIKKDPERAKTIITDWLCDVASISQDLSIITPETATKVESIIRGGTADILFPQID